MARPRTSFTEAVKYAQEEITKNEGKTIEEIIQMAALKFNENEAELTNKIRKMVNKVNNPRKPGRPKKNTNETNTNQTTTKRKPGRPKKVLEAASISDDSLNEQEKSKTYIYDGPINITLNGKDSQLMVKIETNEINKEKAKDIVSKKLYDMGITYYISVEMWDVFLGVQ